MKTSVTRGAYSLSLLMAITIALLSSTDIFAQGRREMQEDKTTFMLGIKGGLSITDWRRDGDLDFFIPDRGLVKRSGGQALAFARYYMTNWVYGELEAGWAQSAAARRFYRGQGSVVYRLNNVQSNLLFGFKLPILSVYEPKVFIGPSFDFNLHASEYVEGLTPISRDIPIKRRTDVTNNFKSMDIGWIIGGQMDFDIDFARLILDVRYRHGMSNINNNMTSNGQFLLQPRAHQTSGLIFQVGLGFPL